jgi:hypothetical protein
MKISMIINEKYRDICEEKLIVYCKVHCLTHKSQIPEENKKLLKVVVGYLPGTIQSEELLN